MDIKWYKSTIRIRIIGMAKPYFLIEDGVPNICIRIHLCLPKYTACPDVCSHNKEKVRRNQMMERNISLTKDSWNSRPFLASRHSAGTLLWIY